MALEPRTRTLPRSCSAVRLAVHAPLTCVLCHCTTAYRPKRIVFDCMHCIATILSNKPLARAHLQRRPLRLVRLVLLLRAGVDVHGARLHGGPDVRVVVGLEKLREGAESSRGRKMRGSEVGVWGSVETVAWKQLRCASGGANPHRMLFCCHMPRTWGAATITSSTFDAFTLSVTTGTGHQTGSHAAPYCSRVPVSGSVCLHPAQHPLNAYTAPAHLELLLNGGDLLLVPNVGQAGSGHKWGVFMSCGLPLGPTRLYPDSEATTGVLDAAPGPTCLNAQGPCPPRHPMHSETPPAGTVPSNAGTPLTCHPVASAHCAHLLCGMWMFLIPNSKYTTT